jgi:TRAP-type mannitol/chloroaromatic compound transport system permease small subunit
MSTDTQVGLENIEPKSFWGYAIPAIRKIDRFTQYSGYLTMFLLVPLIFSSVAEVILRYFFKAPTAWAGDVTFMSNGSLFMLGSAFALLNGAHIRTDILWDKFSISKKGWIDLITYIILFLPVMGLLVWISIDDVIKSFQINEKSNLGLWQPIIWPLRAVVPVAFGLLFIQGISELLKSLWAVDKGTELVQHDKVEI